nr:sulfite exporter TauE/SafE family protein [uncultured Allomuricauda sp.]
MTLNLVIILFLVGLANGFYSGLMGTGGNVILIPALDLVLAPLGIEEPELVKFIIAHSLFITVFNGFAVSYKQYRIGNFYLKEVLLIGIPAVLAGFMMSEIVRTSDWYDKIYFDILFLIMVSLVAIRFLLFRTKSAVSNRQEKLQNGKLMHYVLGLFTGVTTALSGFGGGIVVIPSLTDVFGVPIRKASSISIGVVMLLAIGVTASYISFNASEQIQQVLPNQFGYISMSLVLPILLGVFLAAPFGVKMAHRTKPALLRLIFGGVMVLIIAKTVVGFI